MDFTTDDIASLGDELAALDLTEGESEALRTIVAIATDAGSDDEVSGFAYDLNPNDVSFKADFGSLGLEVGSPRSGVVMSGGTTMGKIINMGDGDEL